MKHLTLLFQNGQFISPHQPDDSFSIDTFKDECRRQGIVGQEDVFLQVVYHTPHFLILPKEMDGKAVYQHHFPATPSQDIAIEPLCDNLQQLNCLRDTSLEEAADEMLPRHALLPDAYLLANAALQKSSRQGLIVLHWTAGDLQIFIARHGQLLFSNSFKVENETEVLYYTAAVSQEYYRCDRALIGGDPRLPSLMKDHFSHLEEFSLVRDIQTFLLYQSSSL